jgi:hypothetical protein
VSNDGGRAYTAGRCSHWIKVKNPAHPAMNRVERSFRGNHVRAPESGREVPSGLETS